MQNAARYREFAETLMTAARDASPETRELIMNAAKTWSQLADQAEIEDAPHEANLIDFAVAGRRLRQASARGG